MSEVRSELSYSRSHEWVKFIGEGVVLIGLTDFAQSELGDLVFVNLPQVGDETVMGESFADVESVKAVSDVFCPVSGRISAVNEAVLDDPALINGAPYETWLVEISGVTEQEELLSASEYQALCTEEG